MRHLLLNKAYLVIVAAFFFVFLSENSLLFYAVLVSAVGGTTAHYGLCVLIYGIVSTLMMFLSAKYHTKFGSVFMLFPGIFGVMLRNIMFSFAGDVTTVLIFAVAQGFAFPLYYPAMVNYVREVVDHKYLSTAFLAVTSVCTGICSIVGSALWGVVAQVFGVQTMFRIAVIPGLIALAILLFFCPAVKNPQPYSVNL